MHVLHVLVGTIQAKNGDVFFITVQIFEKNLVLWLTGLGYAKVTVMDEYFRCETRDLTGYMSDCLLFHASSAFQPCE